jgi:hypothetical protein
MKKRQSLEQMVLGKLDINAQKILDPCLILYIKILVQNGSDKYKSQNY